MNRTARSLQESLKLIKDGSGRLIIQYRGRKMENGTAEYTDAEDGKETRRVVCRKIAAQPTPSSDFTSSMSTCATSIRVRYEAENMI